MRWYLYIAKFKFGLYTGITKDLTRRLNQHNIGRGAKSLIGKGPVTLVYSEVYRSHKKAAQREIEIKSWQKKKKILLIETKKHDASTP